RGRIGPDRAPPRVHLLEDRVRVLEKFAPPSARGLEPGRSALRLRVALSVLLEEGALAQVELVENVAGVVAVSRLPDALGDRGEEAVRALAGRAEVGRDPAV